MPSLRKRLTEITSSAFEASGFDARYGDVIRSDRPDLGQFQCNGALAAAKTYKSNPRKIAESVAGHLRRETTLENVSIAGPGFINLSVTDRALTDQMAAMAADERLGADRVAAPQKIVVDYGGPNVAKPMHVGHLRAAIIGESIKRIARFLGHDVLGDVHLGDWGLQMGMLITEVQRRQPDLAYFDVDFTGPALEDSPVSMSDLEEMYPAASARAQEDPAAMEAARRATFELQQGRPGYRALWSHFHDVSIAGLKADYAQLGVEFDLWLGESDTQDRLPSLIERLRSEGHARQSEGALVMDVALPEDKADIPPLMLLKSDGAVLYGTTDLATIAQRMDELHADSLIYVVDNRQADHFRQVFRGARKSGIAPASVSLEHAGFGTMNGKDGKPFKTRAGGVMKLKDLMELVTERAAERMAEVGMVKDYPEEESSQIARMVGLATLKYADLMNHRTKDYVFDLDRFSSFEGRTGPYLLYTAVRTKSILRKAEERGLQSGDILPAASGLERDVMLKLTELPDALELAFAGRAPNHLCEYGYALATAFNRFYHEHHVLREEDAARQASWIALSELFLRALCLTLELLGIEVPERM
ncbi:MAG: arginine--tRNA ligase [Gemmatimonadetes bacterium]|nr:arginine--tRNA ligase [Gemmatimonadota bacterium]